VPDRVAAGRGARAGRTAAHRLYYTALLVNVGCHSDAHEQAKWFGDDIALKASKYDHDLRSLRAATSGMRFLGSGHAPLHRFRLGLEFVISGHREVDGMIEHHASIARSLAEQLELSDDVLASLAAAYERWDGRGWPGELERERVPVAARLAQMAEFVEVANPPSRSRPRCGARAGCYGAGRPTRLDSRCMVNRAVHQPCG
jgi:HD domain